MPHIPSGWAPLQPILQDIIQRHHEGISEHDLFTYLKSPPYELFSDDALRSPLSLFQSHFILFNALYQLQNTWLKDKTGLLQIDCSCIRQQPWQAGQEAIVVEDKLRSYYLDWANFESTDQRQAEAMLDSFWAAFSGLSKPISANYMEESHALALLELTAPYSLPQVKTQYRKMLHQCHPDKGGNHKQTIDLHHAYQQLKAYGQTQ